jgi:hypothetical protein
MNHESFAEIPLRLACGMQQGECATAWQKAMGEALFETVLAELRNQGSEGPPHRIPDPFYPKLTRSISSAMSPISKDLAGDFFLTGF